MSIISIEKIILIKRENKQPLDLVYPTNMHVELVSLKNIEDASWFNNKSQMDCFKEFINKGYIGCYCYINDICVSRMWEFTDSDRTYLGSHFLYKLKNNETFFAWIETEKSHQGKGAFNIMSRFIMNESLNTVIYASIAIYNWKSLKAHLKLGFVVHKKYLLIKISKLKISIQYFGGLSNLRIKLGSYV